MNKIFQSNFTCPWWFLFTFDNPLRRMVHDPHKILKPYVNPGDRILDIGCGMGYFSIELARLTGEKGKVIAADLQPEMLVGLEKRAVHAGLSDRIEPHLCTPDKIGKIEPVEMAFAFWMVHEVSQRRAFLEEVRELIAYDGILMIVEPVIHVTKTNFEKTVDLCYELGFMEVERPEISMSRAIVFLK